MNKDLRKRLDEAAKKSVGCGKQCHTKDLLGGGRNYVRCRGVCIEYKQFISGAEQGYKEAIAQATEWLHNNLHLYIMSGSRQINYTFLMDGLEKAMNKLWEEKI